MTSCANTYKALHEPTWQHMTSYSERLQLVAKRKKIFQADIALELRKSRSTVSKWWNGEIIPAPKNNSLIAEYLECNPDWLATGEWEPFPSWENLSTNTIRINSDRSSTSEKAEPQSKPVETTNVTLEQEELTVREIVNMTMEILESDTVYKSALASSIRAFHKAAKQEREMKSVQEDVAEMRERMDKMEQMLLSLGSKTPENGANSDNS